jgi:hypothetical protein
LIFCAHAEHQAERYSDLDPVIIRGTLLQIDLLAAMTEDFTESALPFSELT